ncbi:MAG: exodeoxyribonuclease V subunit alpha, partial [Nocardioidaceae bacterium]
MTAPTDTAPTEAVLTEGEVPGERDAHDVQLVRGATGLLADFNRAGVLGAADVHVAMRLSRLGGEDDEAVLLAVALAVRAVRLGSVCLDVASAQATTAVDGVREDTLAALAWPAPDAWLGALGASPLVAVGADADPDRPLRLVDGVLYLDRYWRQEQVIASAIDAAVARPAPVLDADRLRTALARLFPGADADRQRLAAVVAAHRWFSVIAGGPGTGKTTTVARLLALLQDQPGSALRIALAAPTGRAAARLLEAVTSETGRMGPQDQGRLGGLHASTLHRLLGSKPGARTRFRHDRANPLPYDVVVVDEASMVSLTMMSRLVDALRPSTRLILVGDPDQLASVEAGAVLGDLVLREAPEDAAVASGVEALAGADLAELDQAERRAALTSGVVRLSHVYRFAGEIESLAEAVRAGDVDAVLDVLGSGSATIELVDPDTGLDALREDAVHAGSEVVEAARVGDAEAAVAALGRHRLLCGHRAGPYGVAQWSRRVEEWLRQAIDGYGSEGFWYVGRPLLVTTNDYQLRLFNGDTGVVVDVGGDVKAAFRRDGRVDPLPTSRLSEVQT